MGIGTSLGAFHEDEFAHVASPWMENPEMTPDANTLSPNAIMPPAEDDITLASDQPYVEISHRGPSGTVSTIRIPANDNKNLDLGDGGFDIDKAWSDLRKKLGVKPNLTIVPK